VAEHGVDSPAEIIWGGGNRRSRGGSGRFLAAAAEGRDRQAGQERFRESGGNKEVVGCVMHEQAGGADGASSGLPPRIVGVGLPRLSGGRCDSGRCIRR